MTTIYSVSSIFKNKFIFMALGKKKLVSTGLYYRTYDYLQLPTVIGPIFLIVLQKRFRSVHIFLVNNLSKVHLTSHYVHNRPKSLFFSNTIFYNYLDNKIHIMLERHNFFGWFEWALCKFSTDPLISKTYHCRKIYNYYRTRNVSSATNSNLYTLVIVGHFISFNSK